ncbi:hypothetical protein FXO37_31682 [Capsicum annuum]|nr:hypothetical protein FXO37_31682 [Capsicum annuum]
MGYNRTFLIAPAVSSLMPRKKKAEANEKKHEEYGDILFISQGQVRILAETKTLGAFFQSVLLGQSYLAHVTGGMWLDIGEEVLTYFRYRTNRSQNSNGHSRIGWIMSANGLVFHPILENSSTTAEVPECLIHIISVCISRVQSRALIVLDDYNELNAGLYDMIRLEGRYTISEDGEVQQCGPLTISCADPSHVVYGGHVIGRLIAAEAIQDSATVVYYGKP